MTGSRQGRGITNPSVSSRKQPVVVPRLEWGSGNSWPSVSCPARKATSAARENVTGVEKGHSKSCQPLAEGWSIWCMHADIIHICNYMYTCLVLSLDIGIYMIIYIYIKASHGVWYLGQKEPGPSIPPDHSESGLFSRWCTAGSKSDCECTWSMSSVKVSNLIPRSCKLIINWTPIIVFGMELRVPLMWFPGHGLDGNGLSWESWE